MPDITTILLEGDHASLPAAGDVAEGTLYSCSDHDIIYQSDGAAWNNWAVIAGAAPGAHATSHQNGGSDEVSVAGLSGLLADGQTPLAHKTSHENGGADEISVAGLSGLLADPQTAVAHTHAQADVIDLVTDLALKAPLASPVLTGAPLGPTAAPGTNNTQLATTEYVDDAVAAVIADVDDNGLPYVIDGGGAVITVGEKAGFVRIPFTGRIVGWSLYGDGTSGSIVVDSWIDTHANFPPTVADTIWSGTKPEISSDTDAEATGLSIAVTKGQVLRHNVVSVTGFTEATLNYHLTRS